MTPYPPDPSAYDALHPADFTIGLVCVTILVLAIAGFILDYFRR